MYGKDGSWLSRGSVRTVGVAPKLIYSQEIDAEFVNLMEITADLNRRINMSSKLAEDELAKLVQETFDAGIRWTRLSKGGYFMDVSEPYSRAFASIVLG